MRHLYWDLGETGAGACFEVDWRGSTARVALMDSEEYQAYLDEEGYQYYGGFYDYSPIVLQVPYDDYWYLIVDSYLVAAAHAWDRKARQAAQALLTGGRTARA